MTAEQIQGMSYNELIGLVRETNRPPGGRRSVRAVAAACHLGPSSRVLDIGTSTGDTAIELARVTGCEVVGIDLNPDSLAEATARAAAHRLPKVTFRQADATDLPLESESFDLVFCGNVTSLIEDKSRAVSEYRRVLKFGGHIAAIPMYYVVDPPVELVERVRAAIQVNFKVLRRQEALRVFEADDFEPFDSIDYVFQRQSDEAVAAFCDDILGRPHLASLQPDAKASLHRVYREYMMLFRDNLSLMGFTINLLRKTRFKEDPELFGGVPLRG